MKKKTVRKKKAVKRKIKKIKKKAVKKIKRIKLEKIKPQKAKKLTRVSSGIKNLDKSIEGGFYSNSVNLVIGTSGTGKTIFAVQFLMEGIKKGEKVLYITFEEKKEEFYRNMKRFGWDLDKLDKTEKFFFLEYTPEKVRSMLEEGGGSIESIVIKEGIKRMVIDNFTSFALLYENEMSKRDAAIALFNMIKNWGCTSVLTLGEEDTDDKDESSSVEFEADSLILLYFMREKKKRQRYIEILKMRGTKHATEIHPFEITKGGIVIGSKAYVGKIAG